LPGASLVSFEVGRAVIASNPARLVFLHALRRRGGLSLRGEDLAWFPTLRAYDALPVSRQKLEDALDGPRVDDVDGGDLATWAYGLIADHLACGASPGPRSARWGKTRRGVRINVGGDVWSHVGIVCWVGQEHAIETEALVPAHDALTVPKAGSVGVGRVLIEHDGSKPWAGDLEAPVGQAVSLAFGAGGA